MTTTVAPKPRKRVRNSAGSRAAPKAGAYVPRTELGRELAEIRQRIVASGTKLLTMDEILEEIEQSRGGSPWREI